jgi:type I restriction enzyme S subunit
MLFLDRLLASINKGVLSRFPVPLAPINEHRRIVAKIEELFSDLDAGVVALERVRANLKRYRVTVLKAAVEGTLTEDWRAQHPDTEPASVLLECILTERRHKWEKEQLSKFAQEGKQPPKGWRDKYRELLSPETSELPPLPTTWCWGSLEQIAEIEGGITKDQNRRLTATMRDVPYLRVANVQRGYLDLREIKSILAELDVIDNLRLCKGDILFTEGGDRDKLGRGRVWNDEIEECIHQNHVFRARLLAPCLEPKFVSYHGNYFGQQ